jgi:hypothetical protein
MPARAVVFALNDNPRNLFGLRFATRRIRRYNAQIPIHVFFDGDPKALGDAFIRETGIRVERPAGLPRWIIPPLLKWYAVAALRDVEELVYLDTDTIVFDDIDRLFGQSGDQPFQARSFADLLSASPRKWGCLLTRPYPPYTAGIARVSAMLGVEPVLHLNSGVMIFKQGFAARIADHIGQLGKLYHLFVLGTLPTPELFMDIWFIEETCARFFLTMAGVGAVQPLQPQLAPYYHEYLGREVAGPGLVIHTWNPFYDVAVAEFGSSEDLAELLTMPDAWRPSLRPRLMLAVMRWLLRKQQATADWLPELRGSRARKVLGLVDPG